MLLLRLSRAALQRRPAASLLGCSISSIQFAPFYNTANVAWYHATPNSSAPPLRRSRGTAPTINTSNLNQEPSSPVGREETNVSASSRHEPVTNSDHFLIASELLLDRLELALQPMRSKNEVFVVTKTYRHDGASSLSIHLKPEHGTYVIQVDMENLRIQYSSPISGQFLYMLSAMTHEWVGDPDFHSLEGMLVRDLIRQCQGLPDL